MQTASKLYGLLSTPPTPSYQAPIVLRWNFVDESTTLTITFTAFVTSSGNSYTSLTIDTSGSLSLPVTSLSDVDICCYPFHPPFKCNTVGTVNAANGSASSTTGANTNSRYKHDVTQLQQSTAPDKTRLSTAVGERMSNFSSSSSISSLSSPSFSHRVPPPLPRPALYPRPHLKERGLRGDFEPTGAELWGRQGTGSSLSPVCYPRCRQGPHSCPLHRHRRRWRCCPDRCVRFRRRTRGESIGSLGWPAGWFEALLVSVTAETQEPAKSTPWVTPTLTSGCSYSLPLFIWFSSSPVRVPSSVWQAHSRPPQPPALLRLHAMQYIGPETHLLVHYHL